MFARIIPASSRPRVEAKCRERQTQKGITMRIGLAAAAALCALATPSFAAGADWKAVMKGVDGVIVYCYTTTNQSYANEICTGIDKAITTAFTGATLKVVSNGMMSAGNTAGSGESADPDKLRQATGMTKPLLLRIFVKGTDGNTPAIFISVRAAMAYTAATETGSTLPAKAGDLLFEERSFVASGPSKTLPGILVDHVGKNAAELVTRIRTGL